MSKSLVSLIFLLILLCCSFFGVVVCQVYAFNYTGSSESTYNIVGDLYDGGEAVVFYPSVSGYLDRVVVDLHRHGSPNFNVEVALLDASGWNVSGLDVSAVLATCNATLAASSISTGLFSYNFNFTHEASDYVEFGSPYAILVYAVDFVSGDGSNNIASYYSTDNPENYVTGRAVADGTTNWDVLTGYFGWSGYVYEGDPPPTPTPSPSPSPSPAVTQDVLPQTPFVAVPSYYMVLLVLFAVVAVLAGLYVTFEREGENKGVALLFVLVGLVLFVVLIVGYFVGF